jgi:hypothetical protein
MFFQLGRSNVDFEKRPSTVQYVSFFKHKPAMAPNLVPWDRLVRFNDAEGSIKYGEPILESDDADIAALARDGKLKVKVYEGSGPLSCKPTDKEARVEKLLGPLEAKDVPLIYCIGLNYKAHSKPSETENGKM